MTEQAAGPRRGAGAAPGAVVVVLGPDGAGKTTLARSLVARSVQDARYVYMGLWRTRAWSPLLRYVPGGRTASTLVQLLAGIAEVRRHARRGRLVVLDRYVHDALLAEGADTSLGGRFVSALLARVAPDPDVVLVLDVPGETMFARKGEHSPAVLEARRQGYLQLARDLPQARLLDAQQSAPVVLAAAEELLARRLPRVAR